MAALQDVSTSKSEAGAQYASDRQGARANAQARHPGLASTERLPCRSVSQLESLVSPECAGGSNPCRCPPRLRQPQAPQLGFSATPRGDGSVVVHLQDDCQSGKVDPPAQFCRDRRRGGKLASFKKL